MESGRVLAPAPRVCGSGRRGSDYRELRTRQVRDFRASQERGSQPGSPVARFAPGRYPATRRLR